MRVDPAGRRRLAVLLALGVCAVLGMAQQAPRPEWRRIGNGAIEADLAAAASGPVSRAWYSSEGARLYILTASGRVFETSDYEKWEPSLVAVPTAEADTNRPGTLPDGAGLWRRSAAERTRVYSFGSQVFRSDDGGISWMDLTRFKRSSIIGGDMHDLAVSPRDADELVVANGKGLWRSVNGGLSWTGLNESLPNLPVRGFSGLPQTTRGVRILADGFGTLEWAPGEKHAWRMAPDPAAAGEDALRRALTTVLGVPITAVAVSGDLVYAGGLDGRIWISQDKGGTWSRPAAVERGAVQSIFVDPQDGRLALAALAADPRAGAAARVLRTLNAGQYWDDLSSNLPEGSVNGITADRASGTVYAATDRGVFMANADLAAPSPAGTWSRLAGLPSARAVDVRLDPEGNQLFVALDGEGVFAAMAPHRYDGLRLVNAADFSRRPAAPGSLLSVLGGRVLSARAGETAFPVLAASDAESQIQVPFTVTGPGVQLALRTPRGEVSLSVPVENVSPTVFVDRDGTPLVINADSGVLLDGMNPARSNSRLQILATGLGKVNPDWPAGRPAPADEPPHVVAPVRAYLDRSPVEVTRAVLAPGYVGLYLVEVQLPSLVNAGAAELYIDADGRPSNRVRITVEP